MNDIKLTDAVLPGADVFVTTVDDEAVLLAQNTGVYFGLDPVGSKIWEFLTEDGQLTTVWQKMQDHFDAEPERLGHDLRAFVAELEGHGLIRRAAPLS